MQLHLELLSVAVTEHVHNTSLDLDCAAASAHDARGTDMFVVAEHVLLGQPESERSKATEPVGCSDRMT